MSTDRPRLQRNGMPDGSGLESPMPVRMVQLFTGLRGEYRVAGCANNLARLSDRSIRLYRATRQLVDDVIAERKAGNPLGSWFGCVSSFEDCIVSADRAVRFASRLKDEGVLKRSDLPARQASESLRQMRNAIEHTDEMLAGANPSRTIEQGEPIFLDVLDDEVRLGKVTLRYTHLFETIERSASCIAALDMARRPTRRAGT